MIELALLAVTLLLAYSNRANDNFKGVATLYGSGVLNYRQAQLLSTLATVTGALGAVALAEALLKAFSGRGLVPSSVVDEAAFAAAVALAMALGGWLHSRRIAETMSHHIVKLEPRSSFLAHLCTAGLVISASKYGLALFTTHVSVGAISGLSIGGENLSTATLRQIGLSWLATLPCAAIIGALTYTLLKNFLR